MGVKRARLVVVKTVNWVLDFGQGGGVNGRQIVSDNPKSFSELYLKPLLERQKVTRSGPILSEAST